MASVFRALPTCTFRRPSGTKLSTSRTLARFNSRSAPLSRKQAVPRTLTCPFCAHDEAAVVVVEQQPMTWAVRCPECFATGPHSVSDSPVHAIVAWNQRQGRLTVVK